MTSHDQRLYGPARALLVTDEAVLADRVRLALDHGRYTTRVARTLDDAAAVLARWKPHLLVIDIDIDVDGAAILDRLLGPWPQGDRPPVIALTRRDDLKARLAAFERGVDDVLAVPFSPDELVARVLAIMRRTYREAAVFTPVLRLGELEIDIVHHRVRLGETELHLTSLEQNLLYLLAANAGRLLTRDEILDSLWGADYVAESNIVDRHISNLRVKLQGHSEHGRYIATVPGCGYQFVPVAPGKKPSGS